MLHHLDGDKRISIYFLSHTTSKKIRFHPPFSWLFVTSEKNSRRSPLNQKASSKSLRPKLAKCFSKKSKRRSKLRSPLSTTCTKQRLPRKTLFEQLMSGIQ